MADLFDKRCNLQIGSKVLTGLRVAFTVEKKAAREPNKASIQVSGLNEDSRAILDTADQEVRLEAGYADQFGAIFLGRSFRVSHEESGADIITTIEAADGGKDIASRVGSWSYGKGVLVRSIIRDLVAGLGLPLSTASRVEPTRATMATGWAFVGLAADGLDKITRASGLTWSVQDGQVLILDDGQTGDGVEAVFLSGTTGMIGSPTEGEKDEKTGRRRFSVRCLMQPRIRPERIVQIESITAPKLSGNYRVNGVKTTGDTHGADWSMLLDLRQL